MSDAKVCVGCGAAFEKPYGLGRMNWERRKFCTMGCRVAHRRGGNQKPIPMECGAVAVPLTKGRYALIDAADADAVLKSMWRLNGRGYASSGQSKNGDHVLMHRMILPDCEEVDHINGDRIDNRSSNLRPATRRQNAMNMRIRKDGVSRYKGVYWDSRAGKWAVSIQANRERRYLGLFDDEKSAARAYDVAAREMCGEFARTNFPLDSFRERSTEESTC